MQLLLGPFYEVQANKKQWNSGRGKLGGSSYLPVEL